MIVDQKWHRQSELGRLSVHIYTLGSVHLHLFQLFLEHLAR
jgi:hypothetical protein